MAILVFIRLHPLLGSLVTRTGSAVPRIGVGDFNILSLKGKNKVQVFRMCNMYLSICFSLVLGLLSEHHHLFD